MNGNAQATAGQLAAMICNTTLMLMHQEQHEAAQAPIRLVLNRSNFGTMALGMGFALYSITTEDPILQSQLPGNAFFLFEKADIIPVLEFVRDRRQQLLEHVLGDGEVDGDVAADSDAADDESEANGADRTAGGATAGGEICPSCERDGLFNEGCVYCSYEPEHTIQ